MEPADRWAVGCGFALWLAYICYKLLYLASDISLWRDYTAGLKSTSLWLILGLLASSACLFAWPRREVIRIDEKTLILRTELRIVLFFPFGFLGCVGIGEAH